jgi:hypothetical protein
MSRTPTEPDHSPIFREINLSAEIKRMYGPRWNEPELAYEFEDRKFYLRTEDAGIYQPGLQGCTADGSSAIPGLASPGCAVPGAGNG